MSVWARRTNISWRWLRLFRRKREENREPKLVSMWTLCIPGPGDVGAVDFLLPAFESGFRCSRNGGHPLIWIISHDLWYQVYFVIIIAEFLVTVLSITYLRNIIRGWTVTLMFLSFLYVFYGKRYPFSEIVRHPD